MKRRVAGGLTCLVVACVLAGQPAQAARSWEETVEAVAQSVVALKVSATRPFDTGGAAVSAATGFVVDAERGLILTNRHVVHPGPVTADAIFLNHEKVKARPIYRDPVHDFGFFEFDPSVLRFTELHALPLDPAGARVGAEIRVIGNDAGEKLSILDGTLARLDRAAPVYGRGRYNDFNTFYLQAASSSSGGSSGSPVVDRRGHVVALNAGGSRRAASSFFLPLDRVARALERIQAGEPVTRGTLQTEFRFEPFDELGRLGLRPETEAATRKRFPDGIGLLVVRETVPGGPGHGRLEPGDVLVRIEGGPVADFATLEAVFDDAVGRTIRLDVERGGEPLAIDVEVGDLHAITPASYVSFGGAIAHALSYQQARTNGVPVSGVYLASAGYAFRQGGVPSRVVLDAVDGEPVPDLEAFETVMAGHPDGAEVQVRFASLSNPLRPKVAVVRVDRKWFPMERCDRNDVSGVWDCRPAAEPPPPVRPAPHATELGANGGWATRTLAHSLAFVDFDVPFAIDGVQGTSFSGAGLVVDADAGLVVVDRDTVPITLGDIHVTFAGSVKIPARVVALHPEHNLALVAYDPALLGDTPVRGARLRTERLEAGDGLWLVALNSRQQLLTRRSEVARVDAVTLPIPTRPRFRDANVELIALTETVPSVGGVLADRFGRVRALWSSFSADSGGKPSSFFAGTPSALIADMVEPLRAARAFAWRTLAIELEAIPLATARARGLSDEDATRLGASDPSARRALAVRRIDPTAPSANILKVGDLLLEADGAVVTRFRQVERAAQAESVGLRVLRDGSMLQLDVPTVPLGSDGTDRVLLWAGAMLQAPPRALAMQRGQLPVGVYVAGRFGGSPADRHQLASTRRIVAVDGQPTPDLDAFLAAVAGKQGRDSVRLRIVNLDGRARVVTLELDSHYWPTLELRRSADGWARSVLAPGARRDLAADAPPENPS